MNAETKKDSISALRWTIVDRVSKYVIVFLTTVMLARLLGPEAFGVVSMLYIYISISSLFVDFGMGGGLIRKDDLTDVDCSTFFYFNVLVSVVIYLLLFILAPFIASLYKVPEVVPLLRTLCLTIPINSLSLVHKELLVKKLDVKFVTRASLIATVLSSGLGIFCAYKGFGVWSLVILQVSQAIINMLLLWRFSRWVPIAAFSYGSLKELLRFGVGLFLSSFIEVIFSNSYQVLIGVFFSVTYAGLYYQARRLFEIPFLTISNVVDSVSYPILVKFRNSTAELVRSYGGIVKLLIFISFPLTILMLILSDRIVLILLGREWIFSATLLKIISLSGMFVILETVNRSLYKIEGRTLQLFKLELIKKALIVLTIFITYKHGIIIFVEGMVLNAIISFLLNQYFITIRVSEYRRIFQMLINGLLMAAAVFYVDRLLQNPYLSLVLSSLTGMAVYFLFSKFSRIREQQHLFQILLNRFK